MQHWREGRRLPRWVVLADYDNALPVDLENVLAVDSFVHLVKARDEATLVEHYPGPDQHMARGPDGASYAHELVVPMVRTAASGTATSVARDTRAPARSRPSRRPTVSRSFIPGSDWIFAKLYGGPGLTDRVLSETVAPLSRRLLADGTVARWFFIRYLDPDEHLRWRLQVPPGGSPARVRGHVERAMRALVQAGLVRRAMFDTYEREVERYGGGDAMAIAEQWFWADSDCTVEVLDALQHDAAGDRWQAGAVSVDRLLADLGCDLAQKLAVMRDVRRAFGQEFHVDGAFTRALAEKLRPLERGLAELLLAGPARGSHLAAADRAFSRRRSRTRRAFTRLRALAAAGHIAGGTEALAPSYVHMTLNRLFRSEHRMHELVLYDFLAQVYARQLARQARAT